MMNWSMLGKIRCISNRASRANAQKDSWFDCLNRPVGREEARAVDDPCGAACDEPAWLAMQHESQPPYPRVTKTVI